MSILKTAGLVVIKDRKLLLAFSNNKKAFYLPGGKCDPGESAVQTLMREIREELNLLLDKEQLKYYAHVSAPALGELPDIMMEQDCFIHELDQTPKPGLEIGEIQYFDSAAYANQLRQAPGVIMIMQQLKKDNLID